LDSHADFLRALCQRAKVNILAVDYRRAPEATINEIYEDCDQALNWAIQTHLAHKFVLMGDSAGGQLALMNALRHKEKIHGVIAIYPVADLSADYSKSRNNGRVLSDRMMKLFVRCALQGGLAENSPEVSATYADPANLPPLLMLTAGNDILCPDAVAFAEKAEKAGVKVRSVTLRGAIHGFATNTAIAAPFEANLKECAEFLQRVGR